MKNRLLLFSLCSTFAFGTAQANSDDLVGQALQKFRPIPSGVLAAENKLAAQEKVELGKMLFFDPRLSANGLSSCNSCHNLGMGGDGNLETSIGHAWQKEPRNAPTAFNAVFNQAQLGDRRAEDLKARAQGLNRAQVETTNTETHVEKTLKGIPEYRERFSKAFPERQEPVSFENMAEAIEAFEATLVTPASRFDQFLEGNEKALNKREKQGLALFMDIGCVGCHNGINVGGQGYFTFGLVEKPGPDILPPTDKGRFEETQQADEEYVFRIAPLRNVELTAPYFHSGTVWRLEKAVSVMAATQLGLDLKDDEVGAITAFLRTLTGVQPRVAYPILPQSTASKPVALKVDKARDQATLEALL